MIPHAKFLHPYMGFSGAISDPVFRTLSHPEYSRSFCKVFLVSNRVFEHKVKLFFPEIRHGVISVSEVKYSIDKMEDTDDVSMSYRIIEGSRYEEYYVVDDFSVEFTIEISVDFGSRGSITAPVTISCDFIDIYIHNQKISITTHDNNLLFIPYIMSYRTDAPIEVAKLEVDFTNIAVNSDQQYGFIIDEKSKEKLSDLKFTPVAMDPSLLNAKKRVLGMISDAGNEGGISLDDTSIAAYAGTKSKYLLQLPQAIFPDRMTLRGLPLFNPEISSSCCTHWSFTWGSAYFSQYDIPIPSVISKPKPCPLTPEDCKEIQIYDLMNRVIDGYLVLTDKSWQELDDLASTLGNSEKQRLKSLEPYIEGVL